MIEGILAAAIDNRGAGRQGRQNRQQHANSGMEAAELFIVSKGQIQMTALQVRPAVAAAVEYFVIGLVDGAVMVGPEPGLPEGVHPGMGAAGHKSGLEILEDGIDLSYVLLKKGDEIGK